VRLARALPAGFVDAGSAAFASFVVGVFAAARFGGDRLGIYALFFAAFLFAVVAPHKLVFLPAEVRLLDLPEAERLGSLRLTLPAGVRVAGLSAIIVLAAWVPAGFSDNGFTAPMAVTALLTAFLSPIQDHMRRLLHLAHESWRAAVLSVVQAVVVGGFLGVAWVTDRTDAWLPFGALAIANTLTIIIGLAIFRPGSVRPGREPFGVAELAASGKALMGMRLMFDGSVFFAAAIVAAIAGKELVGLAEAARVAARPLPVFITGIAAIINPRSMQAARTGDEAEGRRLIRLSQMAVWAGGLAFLAWFSFDWALNPMSLLVERAYEISGLVAVTIGANIAWFLYFSHDAQLTGGSREVDLFRIHTYGAVAQILVAFSAFYTDAYAVPLALLAFSVTRMFGFSWSVNDLYRSKQSAPSTG
jgi:hypothetical protein